MGSPGPATGKRRRGETGKKPSPLQLPNPNTIARPYVTIAQVASGQPVAGVRNTRNGGLLPPRISPVGQLALGPPVGCTLLIIRRDARPTPAFERVDPYDRVEELARKRKALPPGGEFRRRPVEPISLACEQDRIGGLTVPDSLQRWRLAAVTLSEEPWALGQASPFDYAHGRPPVICRLPDNSTGIGQAQTGSSRFIPEPSWRHFTGVSRANVRRRGFV